MYLQIDTLDQHKRTKWNEMCILKVYPTEVNILNFNKFSIIKAPRRSHVILTLCIERTWNNTHSEWTKLPHTFFLSVSYCRPIPPPPIELPTAVQFYVLFLRSIFWRAQWVHSPFFISVSFCIIFLFGSVLFWLSPSLFAHAYYRQSPVGIYEFKIQVQDHPRQQQAFKKNNLFLL